MYVTYNTLTLSHIIHVHAFIALIKGDNTVTYNTCTCHI